MVLLIQNLGVFIIVRFRQKTNIINIIRATHLSSTIIFTLLKMILMAFKPTKNTLIKKTCFLKYLFSGDFCLFYSFQTHSQLLLLSKFAMHDYVLKSVLSYFCVRRVNLNAFYTIFTGFSCTFSPST